MARLRWGDGAHGLDLYTQDTGRLDDGTAVRWVLSGEHVQVFVEPPEGDNVVACALLGARRLGEITTLECVPLALPHVRLHLETTTRFARRLGLVEAGTVHLRIDPQGIHIMPVKSAGFPPPAAAQ